MPFVPLGSLINFCDCLMAGGTSRKNHSEVGSSYIHFNFTPNQDKATASLIGDVPRGVMLDQPPIFLGGQGGMVGPVADRVSARSWPPASSAGKDVPEEGTLVVAAGAARRRRGAALRRRGLRRRSAASSQNNFIYVGNLHALRQWYLAGRADHARASRISAEACHAARCARSRPCLRSGSNGWANWRRKCRVRSSSLERKRGARTVRPAVAEQRRFVERWPELAAQLKAGPPGTTRAASATLLALGSGWARGCRYVEAVAIACRPGEGGRHSLAATLWIRLAAALVGSALLPTR